MGASFSQMDARDGVRYLASGTAQQNLHYGMRIPNQPYRFASFDAALSWPDLLWRGTRLTLSYDATTSTPFRSRGKASGRPNHGARCLRNSPTTCRSPTAWHRDATT